jgi:hypothetical protein
MRISRSTVALSGLLLVILGVWGGLVPFIGPYFHYAFGSTATWHYTVDRLWLDILPAVAVVLAGIVLLRAGHRVSGSAASWLAIVGGTWFVIGPAVSHLWVHHGATPIGGPLYGSTRQMLELVGYFYGLGALIVAIAAFALGRVVSRPSVVLEPVGGQSAVAEPVGEPISGDEAAQAERAAPASPAQRTRRSFRRRGASRDSDVGDSTASRSTSMR